MNIDKYNIEYLKINCQNRPIFIFVNHKTAVLCWAQIKKQKNKNPDIITFDSHRDFRRGVINGEKSCDIKKCFGSKSLPHLKHFTRCDEFINWDMLDKEQNRQLITDEKKYLLWNNDNFIDVAFMKNIVSNVYGYFLNSETGMESDKCEDLQGKDHFFIGSPVKKFKHPSLPFILDIDIDFFIDYWDNKGHFLVSDKNLKKYLKLQKELFLSKECLGVTIALEPGCCRGENNCLYVFKKLCDEFGLDLLSGAKGLIKNSG